MSTEARSATTRRCALLLAVASLVALAALFPARSLAVPYFPPPPILYWTSGEANGSIGRGWLIGGVLEPREIYSNERFPVDLTLDPAADRIIWSGRTANEVGAVRTGAL